MSVQVDLKAAGGAPRADTRPCHPSQTYFSGTITIEGVPYHGIALGHQVTCDLGDGHTTTEWRFRARMTHQHHAHETGWDYRTAQAAAIACAQHLHTALQRSREVAATPIHTMTRADFDALYERLGKVGRRHQGT